MLSGPSMTARSAQRRWSHGDLVVLKALVVHGETLASLANRLGRPRGAIALKCAELMLPIPVA